MFLCSHELFLEIIEYPLAELIVPCVLCEFRELQIVVNVLGLIYDQISYI